MLSIQQKLSQQQKLTPQQIQYQKLLQLNTISLEQRIKAELEINPVLEEAEYDDTEQQELDETVKTDDDGDDFDDQTFSDDEFTLEDYMNDRSLGSEGFGHGDQEERVQPFAPSKKSLRESLIDQVHLLELNEDEVVLGENIIWSLDRDGYFKQKMAELLHDLKIFEHIDISEKRAEEILKIIQKLDPIGIAARDLRECLVVQLENTSYDEYYSFIAKEIILHHFEDFANKRFDVIMKTLNVTMETLRAAISIIQKMNPKPGEGNIDSEQANQISPDFLIEKSEDSFIVTLNDRIASSVTISKHYLDMIDQNKRKRKISDNEKETHRFLREKFESAKWFIASIKQRKETLLKIMTAILEKQHDFFDFGSKALRPMIYKDIADSVGMDISTISRVVNGKYVQSPQGIHELKYFFSEGLSTDSGSEVSNKHIKELIREICDLEDKGAPHSDDKIAEMLSEKGIHIARRTVAKYREQLKIPVARLRKEL